MTRINFLVPMLLLFWLQNNAQLNSKTIVGNWLGTLKTPGGELELIFKIKYSGDGISVQMDVPAQMAKDLPASGATIKGDSLLIEYTALRANYRGKMVADDNFFEGRWHQAGTAFPLKLKRVERLPPSLTHSQEPKKPFDYNEEEIVFTNTKDKVNLAGTLTFPKNPQKCTAVILISGSGPQDRDESLLGHKPFLVLADYLTKNGLAVLRFDDRSVGKSTGDFSTATSFDFSRDVEAAITYLKTRKEINKKGIGLLGHSEGGLIAPMLAAKTKDVAFIVLMAAPGIKGAELLALQSAAIAKASGIPADKIEQDGILNNKIYQLALKPEASASDSIITLLKSAGLPLESAKTQAKKLQSPWFRYFLAADPANYLSRTHCPVLAINGKKDVQVPVNENLYAIEKNLKLAGNVNYKIIAYDKLNHLFQTCETGLPDEYAKIDETIAPYVLEEVSAWIQKLKLK
jgi:uncharacterized protein